MIPKSERGASPGTDAQKPNAALHGPSRTVSARNLPGRHALARNDCDLCTPRIHRTTALALCVAVGCLWGGTSAHADSAERLAAGTPDGPTKSEVVAVVNNERISRQDLARECVRHYGKTVLESLVNKRLIAQACLDRNIAVTQSEVDAEIERMATRFNLPVQQWMKLLRDERGITPDEYAQDIIWPTLALRKLAGGRLTVTREELERAYETQFGPAVRARLIAVTDHAKAEKIHATAAAHPEQFGSLAKDHSEDANSAAAKGLIQPIRMHGSYKEIEDAAFGMKDGEISPVLRVAGQYVILKREGLIEAQDMTLEQAAPKLEEMIREGKLRKVSQEIFRELQEGAVVKNVLNDPAARQQMPGVAARINDHQITIRELAEVCIKRHGEEVLEGTVNRKLIEQACAKRKITITDQDLEAEIRRAASMMAQPKPDGSPDVQAWLKKVTEGQGISEEVYRHDAVWPSVALKKLVGNKVEVTEEDLRRGFEANYGSRARCRAIVFSDVRRATKVWKMARDNPTSEHFAELASQYSIESGSRALGGEVPPIKKYGGQPLLEEEAFRLRPGELSGVVQVGDKHVILLCEGFTEPAKVERATVRDLIYEDLHEKKLRAAMAALFDKLQEEATVDNYLANTSRSPKDARAEVRPAGVPTLRQVPGQ